MNLLVSCQQDLTGDWVSIVPSSLEVEQTFCRRKFFRTFSLSPAKVAILAFGFARHRGNSVVRAVPTGIPGAKMMVGITAVARRL